MRYALTLLLLCSPAFAVPAPREKVQPASIVGSWDLTWGNGLQQSAFLPDGTCDSPQFGSGTWYQGEDGAIWFSERGGHARYVMVIQWDTLSGLGAWVNGENEVGGWVEVKLKRKVS